MQNAERNDGAVGVFHRSNLRMNIGIAITFTSVIGVAYGILNWTTTILTSHGFTLPQAAFAVQIAGWTSIASSIAVGLLIQRFGSKLMVALISITLFISLVVLGWQVENLPAMPSEDERNLVVALVGITAAIFSMGVASNYAIMTRGYPSSCRSAGIGFGIFMARIGGIAVTGFGGLLLDMGGNSVVPFFTVLCVLAVMTSTAVFVVDKHVPPNAAASTP